MSRKPTYVHSSQDVDVGLPMFRRCASPSNIFNIKPKVITKVTFNITPKVTHKVASKVTPNITPKVTFKPKS